jgi:hypothetical protein
MQADLGPGSGGGRMKRWARRDNPVRNALLVVGGGLVGLGALAVAALAMLATLMVALCMLRLFDWLLA